MAEVRKIPDSITYNRTEAQRALIEAAGEVALEVPELTGYVVIGFNETFECARWHSWPCTDQELPGYTRSVLEDWISEDSCGD